MPYNVNYTDGDTKQAIIVYDNTSNRDTDLEFPGRNLPGYGKIIAENFLRLLENFASPVKPLNPIEGQLWYDSGTGTLQINDGTGEQGWKAASSIQKSSSAPSVGSDKVGEIWVNTVTQQLYVWSGESWVLVGPEFSSESGLRTGTIIETIVDSDNADRRIVKFLIEDIPVAIVSKDSFTPKIRISGFDAIRAGLNISTPADTSESDNFRGGFLPKLNGVASSADALNINNVVVASSRFLRTDITNITEFGLNVRNNSGITLGIDGTLRISNSITSAKIYNAAAGSSIDLQINRDGNAFTTVRILDNKVGVNLLSPQQELDVDGNIGLSGSLIISNATASTNFENGSFRTAGGAAISKNLLVGNSLQVSGITQLTSTIPATTLAHDLGSLLRKWNTVHADTIQATTLRGTLDGDVAGNARTATSLRSTSTFALGGDVTSNIITFNGEGGSKVFATVLTSNIIEAKSTPFPNKSQDNDFVLVFRPRLGLVKQSRNVFVADLAVPIGALLPFAGINVPEGYLLCDGSELEKAKYSELYDVIGNVYGVATLGINTFKIPDLRGRFPLGRDNMDNSGTVPTLTGGFVDAGGGNIDRVSGTAADTLGGSSGSADNALITSNLPEHQHTLKTGSGVQFNVVRLDTAVVSGTAPGPGLGPTAPGQAQYLNNSGGVNATALGQPFGIMNPYLTLNYIIRSGPPKF